MVIAALLSMTVQDFLGQMTAEESHYHQILVATASE
jgi:hypothetical protein